MYTCIVDIALLLPHTAIAAQGRGHNQETAWYVAGGKGIGCGGNVWAPTPTAAVGKINYLYFSAVFSRVFAIDEKQVPRFQQAKSW